MRKLATELLCQEGVGRCDALLLRQLALLEAEVPALLSANFGDGCLDASTCVFNRRLVFSPGEPAINVYTPGGCFTPHNDYQSLTILVNLSDSASYAGGAC